MPHFAAFPSCQAARLTYGDLYGFRVHSFSTERRYYCFGRVDAGVLTVRFAYRAGIIRIIGAGHWRKGKQIYDRENQVP